VPRLAIVVGAIYTGFLLASVYYHLFAVWLASMFKSQVTVGSELLAFFILLVLVSVLMLALLLTVFGHIEIKGRVAVFDKLGGTVLGLFAGVLIIGIFITILRVPYEENKTNPSVKSSMPVVEFFNNGYEKSALAPTFLRSAPFLMWTVTPLLPAEAKANGGIPLLASIVTERK
jgi:uncharacterized membrane protein required for colicin V production